MTSRKQKFLITLGVLCLALQFVPYGHRRDNPPVTLEPAWDSPRTRELAVRACFDCHSNQTRWPWYGYIAPASWLLVQHVEDGRRHLNFSEWQRPQRHAHEAAEEVVEGKMPLWQYELLHGEARLTEAEKGELVRGLERTLSTQPRRSGDAPNSSRHEPDH